MKYIEQKLKEFDKLESNPSFFYDIHNSNIVMNWGSYRNFLQQALTDYHNHIVESCGKYVDDTVEDKHFNRDWIKMHMKEFLSLLQDTKE